MERLQRQYSVTAIPLRGRKSGSTCVGEGRATMTSTLCADRRGGRGS